MKLWKSFGAGPAQVGLWSLRPVRFQPKKGSEHPQDGNGFLWLPVEPKVNCTLNKKTPQIGNLGVRGICKDSWDPLRFYSTNWFRSLENHGIRIRKDTG